MLRLCGDLGAVGVDALTKARLRYTHRRGYDCLHVTVPPEVTKHVSAAHRFPCWVNLTLSGLVVSVERPPGCESDRPPWTHHNVFTNVGSSRRAIRLEDLSRSLIVTAPRWLWPRKGWPQDVLTDVVVVGQQLRISLPRGWTESCPAPEVLPSKPRGRPVGSTTKPKRAAKPVVEKSFYLAPVATRVGAKVPLETPPRLHPRVYTKLREEVRVNRPPAMVRGPSQDAISDGPRDRRGDPRVVVAIPGDPPPGRSALDDRRRGV